MRRKLLRIILALSFLVSFMTAGAVLAQGSQAPGTWVSSINIQNIGSGAATVTITFYDATGTPTVYTHPDTIPAGGSLALYVPTISTLANGQYSAVVSSDQEILVVANASSTNPYTAGAYNGIASADTSAKLSFPGLYNNYYAFYSEVVIQNTEAANSSITLTFYDDAGSSYVMTDSVSGNSAKVFTLSSITTTPALPSGTAGRFALEVVSTSGEKLAGVANIWSSAVNGQFSDYNGFTSGSSVVYAPALYNSYYNFVSALTVQNVDPSNNAVGTVTYSNGITENFDLGPRESIEYYQPNNASLPSGNTDGVFSAKIEVTSGSIVALATVRGESDGTLASYNGPDTSATSVRAPVVMREFYGWFSAVTVQNVGAVNTDVKITYASGETETFTGVAPNGTVNIIQLAGAGTTLPAGSSVSAVIESVGGASQLVAVVQENSLTGPGTNPGDYLLAYTAIP